MYDAWVENSDEIIKMLVKLKIKWVVHKFEKILENIVLLVIVLLFWIKWIVDLMKYYFCLKTLMGNFFFEWQSENSESTKNRKEVKIIITKITQSLK